MPVPSTRAAGRSSPPAGQASACPPSNTARRDLPRPYRNPPGHQGGGIGARLISALIDEAGQKGQVLVLDVLTVNRLAQAAWIGTVNPASARQIALVSPLTPAPITNASSLGVFTQETYPLPARSSPAERRPRYRRAAPAPPQRVASV